MSNDDLVQRALLLLTQPIEMVKTEEALKRQPVLDPIPTVQPGHRITWVRGGSVQTGIVDFLHLDSAGTIWAFATLGGSWAAVNMKFVTGSGDE